MKNIFLLLFCVVCFVQSSLAFCGFYVSKANSPLKNKASQVILVRDGNKTCITIYNDFKGASKDFAMVVPVPVVLKKSDIHVIAPGLFQVLNDYSAPRLVEYYDQNPCTSIENALTGKVAGVQVLKEKVIIRGNSSMFKDESVKIEAKYLVGEYDILILSAKESSGLKSWLLENGYKIPDGAEEVLEPYIKSNLKFFVVKVNEQEKEKLHNNFLSPLQINFNSPKFMLPIRLGMANADGNQDLIVYAFTRKGRIECTNYRNVNMPTGKNVPLFVQKNFGTFYNNLFNHQWQQENENIGFLEYAWDVSPANYYHCDPCIATVPGQQELIQAGVWWLNQDWSDYSDTEGNNVEDYSNKNVHFTRLHFRYNRKSFPQDLVFQVTPNTETFQARYIITHPATGDLSCDAGKKYLVDLKQRRKNELRSLFELTGRDMNNWQDEINTGNEDNAYNDIQYKNLLPEVTDEMNREGHHPTGIIILSLVMLGTAGLMKMRGMI